MIVEVIGKPGVGKSTLFAFLVQNNERKKKKYYKRITKSKLYWKLKDSPYNLVNNNLVNFIYRKNFYDVIYCTDETMKDTVYVPYEDIGFFSPTPNSLFLFEEAGLGLDNRQYKTLKKEAKRFFAIHRHKFCDIVAVSQTLDVDKTLRTRAECVFLATKRGCLTFLRKVIFNITLDEEKHTFIEGYFHIHPIVYFIQLLTCKMKKYRNAPLVLTRSLWFYRPRYYAHFDSFSDDFDYPKLAPDVILEMEREKEKEKEKEIINLEGDLCYE